MISDLVYTGVRLFAAGIASQTGGAASGAGTGDTAQDAIGVIFRSVFIIMGIVAVIFLIIGGVLYATSQGDASKLTKAKNTVIYSLVGLIISIFAFAITSFVLNSLGQ